jgi:hypothetical protein
LSALARARRAASRALSALTFRALVRATAAYGP